MKQVTVFTGDDWGAIYVDGTFLTEGHDAGRLSPSVMALVESLGGVVTLTEVDDELMESICMRFPERIDVQGKTARDLIEVLSECIG